jgi:hypothetical protein
MSRSSMEVVHSSRFNLAVSSPSDRKISEAHICIFSTKEKMTGFNHISWFYSVYVMSSYFMHYSVCHELNTIDTRRSRSISGVIVVDAGRSRCTCHRRNAYIHDHTMNNVITMRFSINCPTVICLPTVCYFYERDASSENYGPRVYFNHITKTKFPLL